VLRYEAVTSEDIKTLANELLRCDKMSVSVLGRLPATTGELDIPVW